MRRYLTREDALHILKKQLPDLRRRYGVVRIALFGSFARGTAKLRSDIDLLVETEHPLGLEFVNLAEDLEKTLARGVDITTFDCWKRGFDDPRLRPIAESVEKNLLYVL
jgi:hypothetical protein